MMKRGVGKARRGGGRKAGAGAKRAAENAPAPAAAAKWVVQWEEYGLTKKKAGEVPVGGRDDADAANAAAVAAAAGADAGSADAAAQAQLQALALDARMVTNNAGARHTFELDDMKRLQRFLCLGIEGGTYYVTEKELSLQNVQGMLRLLAAGRGLEVVSKIVEFSVEGRTAKQQPLMLALAVCARLAPDETVRRAAYACLSRVCRIPTQLFMLIKYMRLMGEGAGWGRLQRKAIQTWYNNKEPLELARAVTKYANREGWTHVDVLRLAHAKPASDLHQMVFQYITKGWDTVKDSPEWLKLAGGSGDGDGDGGSAAPTAAAAEPSAVPEQLATAAAAAAATVTPAVPSASESVPTPAAVPTPTAAAVESVAESAAKVKAFLAAVQMAKDPEVTEAVAVKLIQEQGLAREHLSTTLLNSRLVWEAMLQHMPLGAMLRNLSKMTSLAMFEDGETAVANTLLVVKKLTDQRQLHKARLHPFNILVALKTYQSGRGDKGKLTWAPNDQICKALDEAFQLSFATIQPSGKRFVLGLDVSGSMGSGAVNGSTSLTPRAASAAMAMVTLRVEKECHVVGFCDKLTVLPLRPDMSLNEITTKISNLPFGATDCAQPMLWALDQGIQADMFVVYTDNETWSGTVKPVAALRKYREATGIPAKLVVVGMTASQFTIADPDDAGMLDLCGFDSAGPQILSDFASDCL